MTERLPLDHLPFGVADVDATREALDRIGFTTTEVGTCRWNARDGERVARAASVVFARQYLDLIEIRDEAWLRHLSSSAAYARGLAPSGIVLGSRALDATRDAITGAGVRCHAPYEIVRRLPGADPPEVRYRIFGLRDADLPVSVIADGAPDALRRVPWLQHANAAVGVARVHVLASSRAAWRARAQLAFDLDAAKLDVHDAHSLGGDRGDATLRAALALAPRSDPPRLLAIELAVANAEAAREVVARSDVLHAPVERGVSIAPGAGYGCAFVLREDADGD